MNDSSSDRVLLLQCPFVQLNTPYPAPYYLASWLSTRGVASRIEDHSIALFEAIFCKEGLERLFRDAEPLILKKLAQPEAEGEEDPVRYNLFRYYSQRDLWISTIETIVNLLRGEDREAGHLLCAANGAFPFGPRFERFLEEQGGSPGPDDGPRLASLLLADFADFIAVALDPSFALVRYAESLASSVRGFSSVEGALEGYILTAFYEPLLEKTWDRVEREMAPTAEAPFLLACTIPFPGVLTAALAAARSAKRRFGSRVRTVAGGGYVNTELRSISSTRFFDYFDYLSFDRGYGSLEAILEAEGILHGPEARPAPTDAPLSLYKTIFRSRGQLFGSPDVGCSPEAPEAVDTARHVRTDAEAILTTFPDYREVDFTRYIRPVDDLNPMHRLWSDGKWLKVYLAHGCYWHACAFCDVQLDYIRGYAPVDIDTLFRHLIAQVQATGIRGVHLVDEAAPPASLLRLAQLNRAAGLPLVFWGNIRFEKDFTPDLAATLAAGGLLGVSAGIEVASERGFKRLGKGITLEEVVSACAAFKESGILVHAYLIYGFWDEEEEELVDSAETLRQLFAEELLDSAFWHKFVLTRHSRIHRDWKAGRCPALKPLERETAGETDFADNDMAFPGEGKSERYTSGLDSLLAACMAGDAANVQVEHCFPFRVSPPTVPGDLVSASLSRYLKRKATPPEKSRVSFLGSKPLALAQKSPTASRLSWLYHFQTHSLDLTEKAAAVLVRLLAQASRPESLPLDDFKLALEPLLGKKGFENCLADLREGGLALLSDTLY